MRSKIEVAINKRVMVVFDNPEDHYAKAYLMYRVRCFLWFYKWVKAREVFISHQKWQGNIEVENVAKETVSALLKDRKAHKKWQNKNRKIARQAMKL